MKEKEFVETRGYGKVEILDKIPEIGEEFGYDKVIDLQEINRPKLRWPDSAPIYGYDFFKITLEDKEVNIISEKVIAVESARYLSYQAGKQELEEMYETDCQFGIKYTKEEFKNSFSNYCESIGNLSDDFIDGFNEVYERIYETLDEE